jgi:hypothetical protein
VTVACFEITNGLFRPGAEFVVAFQRRKPAAIGVKAPFPGFIEPAQASSVDKVMSGKRWIHEIKFDGYRVQLHIHNEDNPKVFTRRGNNWTKRFKKIADDASHLTPGSAPRRRPPLKEFCLQVIRAIARAMSQWRSELARGVVLSL